MKSADDFDVCGITLASATAWLRGDFSVGNRVADCPQLDRSKNEVAFLNVLGNRDSYRACVAAVVALNCQAAVAHACGEIMLARYRRQGGLVTMTEEIHWRGETLTAARLLIPPPAFARWLAKVSR